MRHKDDLTFTNRLEGKLSHSNAEEEPLSKSMIAVPSEMPEKFQNFKLQGEWAESTKVTL
jgi:hypothetical protein